MITPCAVVSAPCLGGQVDRSRFPKSVRGASWQALGAPRSAEQHTIVRAHRLTDLSRLRAARGAIPNKARLGALSESSSAGILGNYPTQRRLAECPSRGTCESKHGHPARERFFSFLVTGRGKPSNDFIYL